jgi:hypothetical protein
VLVTNTSLKRMMLGCSSDLWLISSRSTFLHRHTRRTPCAESFTVLQRATCTLTGGELCPLHWLLASQI